MTRSYYFPEPDLNWIIEYINMSRNLGPLPYEQEMLVRLAEVMVEEDIWLRSIK